MGHKLKKIYVGDKLVRPYTTNFEYSYDFTNKTWTQVQDAGWTLLQGTSWTTINAYGINMPTRGQGDNNKVKIYYPINCTGASKIKVQMTYYGVAESWGNYISFGTRLSSDFNNTYGINLSWGTTTYSGYEGRYTGSTPNLTLRYNQSPVTGTYTSTAELDLNAKSMKFTRSGLSELTGTIPDGDVTTIRNMNCIGLIGGHDIGTLQLRSMYIKIEH